MTGTEDLSGRSPRWLLAVLSVILSLTLLSVLLELMFRYFPVASGLRSLPVTSDNSVFRHTPNRAYTY